MQYNKQNPPFFASPCGTVETESVSFVSPCPQREPLQVAASFDAYECITIKKDVFIERT